MKEFSKIELKIREILNEWDPIGGDGLKCPPDEYDSYISGLNVCLGSEKRIELYLEDMLLNKIGLPYDANNPDHKADLVSIRRKLFGLRSESAG